jgi:hypothetical protein
VTPGGRDSIPRDSVRLSDSDPHRTSQRPDRRHQALQHRRNQPDTRSTAQRRCRSIGQQDDGRKPRSLPGTPNTTSKHPATPPRLNSLPLRGPTRGSSRKSSPRPRRTPPATSWFPGSCGAYASAGMCGQATAKSHRFTDSNVSADLSGGSIPQRGHDPTRPSRSAGFYYHRTPGAE